MKYASGSDTGVSIPANREAEADLKLQVDNDKAVADAETALTDAETALTDARTALAAAGSSDADAADDDVTLAVIAVESAEKALEAAGAPLEARRAMASLRFRTPTWKSMALPQPTAVLTSKSISISTSPVTKAIPLQFLAVANKTSTSAGLSCR